ncbi:conserved hypothetical protein [Vibrio crassostreae]|nr:conserved hypothetical protein [Vibrio crassostreae]CAK1719384.1 conserved hypothetical protein [Vibrio crassostreae]CAK1727049.1 conserved hypothetical protein [Vibrio crassostreae]CAK1729051.1 conserved hypothetical protein [Vibrio crassostreae]CAK1744223.1 conserved hypothetical protein [Vibrio crassostreae]
MLLYWSIIDHNKAKDQQEKGYEYDHSNRKYQPFIFVIIIN